MVKVLIYVLLTAWVATGIASDKSLVDKRISEFDIVVNEHYERANRAGKGETIHDRRLTTMICSGYADLAIRTHKPTGLQIVFSLDETTKTVRIPVDAYRELLTRTLNAFSNKSYFGSFADGNFCAYLQEQYDINRKIAAASRYTGLLVLTHPSIPHIDQPLN